MHCSQDNIALGISLAFCLSQINMQAPAANEIYELHFGIATSSKTPVKMPLQLIFLLVSPLWILPENSSYNIQSLSVSVL